jgi:hypothetical protein
MTHLLIAFLSGLLLPAFTLQESDRPLPELSSFLQEVRKHLRSDRLLLSQYTFTQTNTERHLDGNGNVKKTEIEVYEVYPSLEEGQTYRKLISKDGKPLSPRELEKQDQEHEKKSQERTRKLERERVSERAKREAKEAEEKRKEDETIDEIFRLYDFSLIGREAMDGHSTISLGFQPRPGYKAKTDEGKIFQRIGGRGWFSETDHELVRLELELIDTISFGMGILARLNKGARLTFQRDRINKEVWLPASAHFSGSARLLVFKGLKIDVTSEYSDYRKFTVESSVTYSGDRVPQ